MPRNRRRRVALGGARLTTPPAFQAAGAVTSGGGNISVPWPAHAAADIGLLFVGTSNEAVATPSGWNAVTNGSQGVGSGGSALSIRLQCFWRRAATAAEADAAVLDGGSGQTGVIVTFRGCVASGDPINVSAGNATVSAATAVTIPGSTTTVANCLVVAITGAAGSTTQSAEANASLVNLTERVDVAAGVASIKVVTGDKLAAGVYDATTATLAASRQQGRVSLALLPV
jgi:hypothetical protein